MRTHAAGMRPATRMLICLLIGALVSVMVSGVLAWCWTQAASLIELRGTIALSSHDAAHAMWRLIFHGGWGDPAAAFPTAAERRAAPATWGYILTVLAAVAITARVGVLVYLRTRSWAVGSPLGKSGRPVERYAVHRGWVRPRTWAQPADLRRLWVPGPASGRPYLGLIGRRPQRMLAAEPEVQPMIVAPPRVGKTTGYVIPWLLDHDGPALVLSTKRDVYDATAAHRARLGRVWVYDPFGEQGSAGFTPLVPAASWSGAIRAGEALASAAHPDQANAANEFWDKEAGSMLAPLLHAAALASAPMGELIRWLDSRDFQVPVSVLKDAGAATAADQLEGVDRRDERNRETTVMSALNLLRAYRHPQVAECSHGDLTPGRFLDGKPNTIYVVAAEHDQESLRPVILALLAAVYHAAIAKARRSGALDPRLFILADEAANIAPVRNLASWLSQCGDHGIVIATAWQSIAQIEHRYGRAARDAICAAATAQIFLPPLADPTSTGYLSELLGEEPVANTATSIAAQSVSIAREKAGPSPWLRQVQRGQAILIYRDLPPAVVRSPRWFEDRRFASVNGGMPSTRRIGV